jgi:uncharacterized protein
MRLGIFLLVLLGSLWLLVAWLQPRMAFFPWKGIQQTPASVASGYRDLKILTVDGETLHGWWIAHQTPRAQVIYWHGNGGNLSLWMDVLLDIHRRGFSVLAVDYRGYGSSTGRPSERGVYRDAEAATAFFENHLREPGQPTIYWGRSLGCAVASFAAAKRPPDALILESPFADVRSLFTGNPLMLTLSVFSTYRFPTARHLEGYTGPLLVMHGDADSIIPFSAGQTVFERARSENKTFVMLEDADHNDVHGDHPAYWKAVDAFLAR